MTSSEGLKLLSALCLYQKNFSNSKTKNLAKATNVLIDICVMELLRKKQLLGSFAERFIVKPNKTISCDFRV